MSDNDKNKGISTGIEESVDDILAGILNPDGTFNDEFNGLFAKYVGGGVQTPIQVPVVDISDRSDEEGIGERPEYDATELTPPSRKTTADERITEKMPEGIREVYTDASVDARRPEFTSTGDVKYPTMGVGESEERVVFDADWEETARKEAQRLERVRQDRMLRGDSTYARSFVAGGSYLPRKNPYIDAPAANSLYIDPLSGDEDFEAADINSEYYNSNKKPFFPEGFSAVPKNNSVAGGKTERPKSNRYVNNPVPSDMDWLQVEDKGDKKKKRRFGKKKKDAENKQERPQSFEEKPSEDAVSTEPVPPAIGRVQPFSDENMEEVISETKGLRSTVAQIVDKYNKRSEEEARRKLEEEARLEELRREEELRERRRQEEIRILKQDMSPELCEAIDSEEKNTSVDEYDDFSTVPTAKEPKKDKKAYGVVFEPEAMNDDSDMFIEKLDNCDAEQENGGVAVNNDAPSGKNNKSKKRSGKKSGRKDN